MVPSRQPSASAAQSNWQEHIDGNPRMSPPVPPLAPCKLTGSLFLTSRTVTAECNSFSNSVNFAAADYVQTVAPNGAGKTTGMLGFMFWAAECEGSKTQCTTPPNACTAGLGAGSKYFNIAIPMPPLRQDNDSTPIRLTAAAYLHQQGFAFNVTGTPGLSCIVQGSTDLKVWIPVQTNVLPFSFTDSLSDAFTSRYYRALHQP
jgi:hypothetical protein